MFTLTLRPEPDVDAVRALKAALKTLLRLHGVRFFAVREAQHEDQNAMPGGAERGTSED